MSQLSLPLVDPESAPEPARTTLAATAKRYGFLPNLYRVFANAPIALDAYLAVSACFERGTLTPGERNVVLLAASRSNGCRYCVAVHSTVADMQKDDPKVTEALRAGVPIEDQRLEALRRLAEALVTGRGHAEAELAAFVEAGFAASQVLEVLVGIALKTLSNYTNHIAVTPLDGVFAARAWTP
ncbi:MAG: carboxymuconolactone decarboxylase family protein [Myxococcales bacterium]|nr:carboxymuconolactone decarboxylase family protein [Myxococcales bacterium]